MMRDEDDNVFTQVPSSATLKHEIGADLSAFSVHELQERIALLNDEAERLRENMNSKRASAEAANAFFAPKR